MENSCKITEFIKLAQQNTALFNEILNESIKNKENIEKNDSLIELKDHICEIKERIEYYISTSQFDNIGEKNLENLFEIHNNIGDSLFKHTDYLDNQKSIFNFHQITPSAPPDINIMESDLITISQNDNNLETNQTDSFGDLLQLNLLDDNNDNENLLTTPLLSSNTLNSSASNNTSTNNNEDEDLLGLYLYKK